MLFSNSIIGMLAWISTWHIVALLVIVLLLFGGRKLPELARGLARGMRIFRDELHGIQKDLEEPPPPPRDNASQKTSEPGTPTSVEKK
ncbi:MAG: twin-arginine translocase TatA/TatE family subunit [Phycisphaerae bacterium]